MTEKRKSELKENYRKCLDLDLSLDMMKADMDERKAVSEDGRLRSELDAMYGSAYSEDILNLGIIMDEALRYRPCEETVYADEKGNPLSEPQTVSRGDPNWLRNGAVTLMKAIEMRQSLVFRQLEARKSKDSALNVFYYPLSREDYERDPKTEIANGKGELSWDYGKGGEDDSISGELKRSIEKGVASDAG